MIQTLEDTFYIQPLPSHLIRKNEVKEGQPHVIYRRSIEEFSSDYHVSENGGKPIKRAKPNRHRRRKRQATHKFLEIALVADHFAISASGEDEIEYHLLAIAHIVTQLYHDSSIGPIKITPVIVRLVLKKDFGYDSSSTQSQRIKALEQWASEHFPHSDRDSDHPDAVVLITKRSSGGIASVGTTCRSSHSAALSNDNGLGSAIVVAHELAHTMGVVHDGHNAAVSCVNHKNIMATVIPTGLGSMKWSACSREMFQNFLRYKSECLDDIPPMSAVVQDPKEFYGKLPGQVINRDEQCKMIFGKSFYACPQRLTYCAILGCTKDGYSCYASSTVAADGTRCGDRHWCINGECVDDGSRVINGRWSNWSMLSKCTRPCGGGVQSRSRTCTNPSPTNGGRNCIGPAEGHWQICNSQPCPVGSKSFRQLQCEEIDPDYKAHYTSDTCSLTCKKGGTGYPQRRNVKDGTRCVSDPTNRDVCIHGTCKRVACDNRLDSEVKRDRCGVCGGDSSKCRFVQRKWNENCPGFGASKACPVLEVPIGSTSVYVEQDTPDRNLLGIKNKDGKYIIEIPSYSRTVYAAGSRIRYYHEDDIDINTVYIPGPTTDKLTIVFVPAGYSKTGVWYELYDPTLTSNVGVGDVEWNVTASWGTCSWKCAKGKQKRTVECTRRDDGSYVAQKLCLKKSSKPAVERSCNTQPCQPKWYSSKWSSCSRTCGKGVQKRQIHCRRKISQWKYEILSDSSCRGTKPSGLTQRSCNKVICHAEWKATSWSKCSSTCRGGLKKRSFVCKRLNDEGALVTAPGILCHQAPKPNPTTMDCNKDVPCPAKALLIRYRGVGCFKDHSKASQPRAIPEFVQNFRSNINWSNINGTINRCAEFIHKNYPENKVFGIQYYGECWTGNEAEHTYDMYGSSTDCWNQVGRENTNYVYEFY
ncbi:metalloendopeptidase [Desmophyllum pertusum]|uniref:Metalloendopeptidase n=1 Tax=Desmophyllum pertusum TaxID=174260 RepID=A0A9W9YIG6_9CNID|nr:metalloendopeptidase [Desmophyllum pertusum]